MLPDITGDPVCPWVFGPLFASILVGIIIGALISALFDYLASKK